MQSTMMRTTPLQSRTSSPTSCFKASRACPTPRKHVVVAAQAEERVRGPAKAASALAAAAVAAQLALTGAAMAVDPSFLKGKDVPQIFSPKDAQDVQEGRDQKPSPKYVEQAKKFAGETAASKIADAPRINKEGGGVGRADFAPSQQPGIKAAGKSDLAPKDIRGGTPAKTAGWMNVLDLSAAPIVSKDAQAANDGKANLPKPGAVSNALTSVGKKVTDSLPNAPDISNPKAAEGKPTISKLANNKPAYLSSFQVVADVADASLGDNKPNFPTPDVNPSNNQDVFKQLGDKLRGVTGDNAPNPGKVGEGIAQNINGPDPKGAASEVSKNLPDIAQKTDIAPESIGAKANVRN